MRMRLPAGFVGGDRLRGTKNDSFARNEMQYSGVC